MVGKTSQLAGCNHEAHPDGLEWYEAQPDGREALPKGRDRLGNPPGGPGEVGRPSRRAGSGWEALLEG